jgi:CheY-like chemotaxis protein
MASVRTIRLLVVEDDTAYLYLVQKAFSARGEQTRWEVTVAKDGAEALHLLFKEENDRSPLPDLVLLDWNLPKVSGDEVLRRVKEHPKLRRIPVLVFSSSEADDDIHAAYDHHANGYITKPGTAEDLEAVVETIERFWIAIARLPKVAGKTGGAS